jgi:hypothetical protein
LPPEKVTMVFILVIALGLTILIFSYVPFPVKSRVKY